MDTKTYEDWSKYIGTKPHRFGVIARRYTDCTLSYLTDGLRNVFYNKEKVGKFQNTDSLVFEWSVENNQIKHIAFAEEPTERGENGSEITMVFEENYYQKYDIFRIDGSKQQCQVITRPVRKHDRAWEVQVRLIDNNFDSILDTDYCKPGDTTTFQSVATVELSEEGFSIKLIILSSSHKTFLIAGKLKKNLS